jgi:hypothetical protein
VSLTSLQNKGLKRHFRELEASTLKVKHKDGEEEEEEEEREESDDTEIIVNSIKGSKKRRLAVLDNVKQSEAISDPNVVGFEVSLK